MISSYKTIALLMFVSMVFPMVSAPLASADEGMIETDGEYFVEDIPDSAGGGFEPHILAAPSVVGDEWIYIDSPSGLFSRTSGYLWISKDHGDTWEFKPKGPGSNSYGGSGDSYTAITQDGTIYYTDLLLASVTVQTSTDGGDSWIRNPQASVTPIDDRQWFGLGPAVAGSPIKQPEALYLAYNQIPGGFYMQRAQITEFGFLWRPCNNYRPISSQARARDNFAVDRSDGTVYAANTEGNTLAMYVSTNGCASFDRYEVMTTSDVFQNIFTVTDVDAEGNVYIVWSTQKNVSMARSMDKGASWDLFNVTYTNGSRVLPWITAGDEGRIAISYYETNETGNVEEFNESVNWSVRSAICVNALEDNLTFYFSNITNYTHSGAIRVSGTGGNSDRDLGDYMSNDVDMYGRNIVTFGNDGNDGANQYNSKVMFGRQIDGPFLKVGVGPVANFTYWTQGLKAYLDGSRSYDMNGEGIKLYEWSWGDGNNETGPFVNLDLKKPGRYEVTLRVTNMLGMRSSIQQFVVVNAKSGVDYGPGLGIIAVIIIVASIIAYLLNKRRKNRRLAKQ